MTGRVAALAILVSASSAAGQEAPPAEPSDIRPWDGTPVVAPAPDPDDSLDLRPDRVPGPRRLRLVRRNDIVVDDGRIDSRLRAEVVLSRSPAEGAGARPREEIVEWDAYRFGFAQGGTPLEPAAFPRASEIAFRWVPGETDLLASPVDVSGLVDGVAGVFLQAMLLDATTWDALLDELVDRVGSRVAIGTIVRIPAWDAGRPLPGPSGTPSGDYRMGPTRIEVAGITRVGGEPCALLWFSTEGSEVTQSFELGTVSIAMAGGEWFRGTMAVSLVDGRVVRGELWGPVVQRVETRLGDGGPTERSSTTIQSVALWEIDEGASP